VIHINTAIYRLVARVTAKLCTNWQDKISRESS